MEVGTVEPVVRTEKKRRRRAGISGGGGGTKRRGGGGGGDSGDNGGGGDDPRDHGFRAASPDGSTKSRIFTAFLLLVVLMTFGGLIGAYIVIATNRVAEWNPFELPIQVWISTFLILVSSVTYHFAKTAIDSGNHDAAKRFLIATTALGAAFISSQLLVWIALVGRGYYMSGNPYAGFFYILTAVHAVHVLGGVIALGAVVLRTWNETTFEPELHYRRELAQVVGWYWHFMDALWVVLFVLLGFWK
jgi:cytochrome c oxidase subunit 3